MKRKCEWCGGKIVKLSKPTPVLSADDSASSTIKKALKEKIITHRCESCGCSYSYGKVSTKK